jgi:hypothetical protein
MQSSYSYTAKLLDNHLASGEGCDVPQPHTLIFTYHECLGSLPAPFIILQATHAHLSCLPYKH